MPFVVQQQVQISPKILPQIPNLASLQRTILVYLLNFVKNQYFRHDGQFSSFRQFFVKNEIPRSPAIDQLTEKCRSPDGCAPANCCIGDLVYVCMRVVVIKQLMH